MALLSVIALLLFVHVVSSAAIICPKCRPPAIEERPPWMTVEQYCGIFQRNAEAGNLPDGWSVDPICLNFIDDYMTTGSYDADHWGATIQSNILARSLPPPGPGIKYTWIFDIDETLLSNLDYFRSRKYGPFNRTDFDIWVESAQSKAIRPSLDFYNELICANWTVILISTMRSERQRAATVKNLLAQGFSGWDRIVFLFGSSSSEGALRHPDDKADEGGYLKGAKNVKGASSGAHKTLGAEPGGHEHQVGGGGGGSHKIKLFKLPNPMYSMPSLVL